MPKRINRPAKKPVIISTAGVIPPTRPTSALLLAGRGAKIDVAKMLVLEFVQTDLATGTKPQSTWGQGPPALPAKNAIKIADKLNRRAIGSRVVVLHPPTAGVPASATQQAQPAVAAQVLILDVVGQY